VMDAAWLDDGSVMVVNAVGGILDGDDHMSHLQYHVLSPFSPSSPPFGSMTAVRGMHTAVCFGHAASTCSEGGRGVWAGRQGAIAHLDIDRQLQQTSVLLPSRKLKKRLIPDITCLTAVGCPHTVVAGLQNGRIIIADRRSPFSAGHAPTFHEEQYKVRSMTWSDDVYVAVAAMDAPPCLLDLRKQGVVVRYDHPPAVTVTALPGGVVAAATSSEVGLFESARPAPAAHIEVGESEGGIVSIGSVPVFDVKEGMTRLFVSTRKRLLSVSLDVGRV